jgi:DNA polymerase-3 subunit delta
MLGGVAELKPAYLLTGSDRPKIARAFRRLRDRVGDEATEVLSALEAGGHDVVAACNAMGLFAVERRLVAVEEVDRWKAADVEPVIEYLAAPAPTTVLALVAAETKPDSPLGRAISGKAGGEVLVYNLPQRGRGVDLPKWVLQQFAEAGTQATPDAARTLVSLVGDDPQELATEVDKLCVWAGGEPIGEREVTLLVAPRAEAPPFALTDSWGRRDVAGVVAAAEEFVERSGDPPRDVFPRIVGLLTSHVSRVSACHAFAREGVTAREAAERLKKNRFYVEKLFEQASNFTADELRVTLVRLAELDLALKGGSPLPGELEFTRALVEMTRARGATAAS